MTDHLTQCDLGGNDWTVRPLTSRDLPTTVASAFAEGAVVAASVPGCVHDDLLAAHLIDDPYLGDNEEKASWIGHETWRYEKVMPTLPQGFERLDLVADGLDTIASVAIDDHLVAQTRDQHRSFRWDVTDVIKTGSRLSVEFASAYDAAEDLRQAEGEYPSAYDEPFNYVRKMASNFGWDWGPTVVTAGIWRAIRVEAWNTARLSAVRPHATLVTPTSTIGQVDLDIEIERSEARRAVAVHCEIIAPSGDVVAVHDHEFEAGETWVKMHLELGEVERWWPHDMGAQPLYQCCVTLREGEDELDQWQRRIGFRSVELVSVADEIGRSFGFVVGGRPIFAKGYNWIPNDLLVHRVTRADYRARLIDALKSGATILRVWGGGIIEKDEFFELCDELGLMVWQDFLFACAAYCENDDFTEQIEAEERDNITRVMSHPSLVLWNGCNENLWGYEDWNWKPVLGERGWGAKYYFDLQPKLIAELDPTRPYWPGSPYSGDDTRDPDDPNYGCFHSWEVWNQTDYANYAATKPRFVSEFGWCGPATWKTMADCIGAEHMTQAWDSVFMRHYKSQDGEQKLRRAITDGFTQPVDFDTWHYAAQVQQARAVRFGIDWWRSLWPRCQGAIIWQLNDCWPVNSWACVDSAGRRKPVWYGVKQAFAERLAVVFPNSKTQTYELSLINNTDEPWLAEPWLRLVGLDGEIRSSWTPQAEVSPQSVLVLPLPPELVAVPSAIGLEAGSGLCGDEALIVDVDTRNPAPESRRVLARYDKDLDLVVPRFTVAVEPDGDGGTVVVTAQTLVRDLLLQADRLGGEAPAGLITLVPGESYRWQVTHMGRPLTVDEIVAPVILTASDVELRARIE